MKRVLLLLLLTGCTIEPDTRLCADYGSRTYVRERCVPLYGQLICSEEEVTEVYCKRYFEEEDNGNY